MRTIKMPIVVLVLIARINRAEIIIPNPSLDESSSIVKDLVKIVTTCYGDKIDAIGLAGKSSDALIKSLSAQHLLPVVLIDDKLNVGSTPSRPPVTMWRKLGMFIIEANDHKEFVSVVSRKLSFSVWWNKMAVFFVLDRSPECDNSGLFVISAWLMELLNVKVICHTYNSTLLFDYNPFTSRAPAQWRLAGTTPVEGHNFTFFIRKYTGNDRICVNLDFDKVKDLGGYKLLVEGFKPKIHPRASLGKMLQRKAHTVIRTWSMIFRALNVTPRFVDSGRESVMGGDLTLYVYYIGHAWSSILTTYPTYRTNLVIVSQFRGHKSQLSKILSVIDVDSRIGMGIVYIITFIFFKFFVRQALIPTVLNLVRITCNTGFAGIPDNTPSRLFITGLLFFVVTMQGIYQGELAALLTQNIPLRNVNKIQDIVDLVYEKVYIPKDTGSIFSRTVLVGRLKKLNAIQMAECANLVAQDSSAVCISDFFFVYDNAQLLKLHVSDLLPEQFYLAHAIRWDWPLEERMNVILAKFVEADIHEPWHVKCAQSKYTDLMFDEVVLNNADFKIIELGEVMFAFVILAIGLICSTIVFIIEVSIDSHKTKITNVRVQTLS